jgi:predicted GNAT family acetyltransferase
VKPDVEDISITNQTSRQRYELAVGGTLAAVAEYRPRGGNIEFVHTEVVPQYEGKGLAQQLAQHALDDVRSQGRKAVVSCSYMAKYIERHPQYQDLLAGDEAPR